jgi:hypothetical protein
MKPITKGHNRFDYLALFVMAFISAVYGAFYKEPIFYVVSGVLFLLGLFRKYWLHKRLK